jgi:NADH-quinone oxidoreductase subunit L
MIGRTSFLFALAPSTLTVVAGIAAATAILAASIGIAQNDIKKVLAYSTVSQLGYMFVAMGVGAWAQGIFHLVTHAFFKACLFLGSGSVIHAMGGEQDMQKMGGLRRYLPRTYWTFLLSVLAIAGVPGTAGFFSKDNILAEAWARGGPVLWAIGAAGAGITAFYMFRQLFLVFFGECRADEHTRHHLHESPASMTVPLVILALGAFPVGLLGLPAFLGPNLFAAWLEPVFGHGHEGAHLSHAAEMLLTLGSVGVAASGAFLAYLMYQRDVLSPAAFTRLAGGALHRLVFDKYYVDELYQATVVRGTLALATAAAWIDRCVIDGVVNGSAAVARGVSWASGLWDLYVVDGLVNAVADTTYFVGGRLRRVQTGAINAYLVVIVVGVLGGVLLYWSWAQAY